MGFFEGLFVVMTIAIPAWFWTRTTTEKAKVDWNVLDRNMARIVESGHGFPNCSTLKAVDIFHELCEDSLHRSEEGKPLAVERASSKMVFSCFYDKENFKLAWRLESSSGATMECGDPGGHVAEFGPGFNFNSQGLIRSFEFWDQNNDREVIPYRNCRVKALRAKSLTTSPPTLDDFLQKIGSVDKDPADIMDANLMCYTFDSSPLWKPWREKYDR
jgi:hypothetical protein